MRAHIAPLAATVLLVAAAAPAAAIVHTLQVGAHGQCRDGSGGGGGGSVYVFPFGGEVDAVGPAEAESVAQAVALFAQGSADDAGDGSPGDDDACPSQDRDASGDETHGSEDHVSARFYWLQRAVMVGACYDDEGAHTTADCHQSSSSDDGGYPSGSPHLP